MSDFDKVRLLQRQDAELEAQLEGRTNKAVKAFLKRDPSPEPTPILRKPQERVFTNTPEAIGQLMMRDLAFEIEEEKITNKAIGAVKIAIPPKVKSEITQQMIEDYRIQQAQPKLINGKYYKYIPSTLNLDLADPPDLEPLPAGRQYTEVAIKRMIQLQERKYAQKMESFDQLIVKNRADRLKLEKDYDKVKSDLDNRLSRARAQKSKDTLQADIIKATDNFNISVKQIDNDFMKIQNDMQAADQQFNILLTESREYLRIVLDNKAKTERTKLINANKFKMYINDLELINNQLLNVNQGPNESDEDFKRRLLSVTNELNDDEIAELISRQDVVQAKRNFKEFFTDGARIETIIKFIDSPEYLHVFNKIFLKIKKLYLEKYGFDNKNVSDYEVVEYIESVMRQPDFAEEVNQIVNVPQPAEQYQAPPAAEPEPPPPYNEDENTINTAVTNPPKNTSKQQLFDYANYFIKDKVTYPITPNNKIKEMLHIIHAAGLEIPTNIKLDPANTTLRTQLNKKLVQAQNPPTQPMQNLVSAMTGQSKQPNKSKDEEIQDMITQLEAGIAQKKISPPIGLFEEMKTKKLRSTKKANKEPEKLDPLAQKMASLRKVNAPASEEDESEWQGSGINTKEYSKMMKFGKVAISPDDLYYKNILKIRLHNKRSILGIPDIRVSDSLAAVLMKIVDGEHVTRSDLSILNKKDKMIYDKLMVISGLHKTIDNTFDDTASEMKQRMRLIEGELGAGNNNPMLLKESHQLLNSMHACGMISARQANKHYKDIKSYF